MAEINLTLIKGDAIGVETDYRDSLPVNMSAVVRPLFGVKGYMLQEPGIEFFCNGKGVDRGAVWNSRFDAQYRVNGGKLIQVDADGTVTELGIISGLSNETAAMPFSFNTQAVVTDGKMWLYDPTNGFRAVTDGDLGQPIDCIWIDGYYLLTDGENLYHTELSDESAIEPIKFGGAEFSPDPIKGLVRTQDNKVAVFGRFTLEYFYNDPTKTNFVFSRVRNRFMKLGLVATHAKVEIAGTIYLLGGRKEESISVHAISIGQALPIASREVQKVISKYTEAQLQDVVFEARVEKKKSFLIIHLPNETIKYDIDVARDLGAEYAWTILQSEVGPAKTWRAIHGVFDPRLSTFVYGDKVDQRLGKLDDTVGSHYGDPVSMEVAVPFVYLDGASIDELEVETVPGHTIHDDATLAVSITYDGVTYGTEEFFEYGGPGEYGKRFIVRRLGMVDNWAGLKLRGACKSRIALSRIKMNYG